MAFIPNIWPPPRGGILPCQSGFDASDSISKMFFVKSILTGNKCFCTCVGGFIFILIYIDILPAEDFVCGAGIS